METKNYNTDRQLRLLIIEPDLTSIKVVFEDMVIIPSLDGISENTFKKKTFSCESDIIPHKDLLSKLKKLRNHALELFEVEFADDDTKAKAAYHVWKIKIAGDIVLQQSRIQMTLGKKIERTGKVIPIDIGQVTMYGGDDQANYYPRNEEMSEIIEDLIGEVWLYCFEGKCMDAEPTGQLPLFPPSFKIETMQKVA